MTLALTPAEGILVLMSINTQLRHFKELLKDPELAPDDAEAIQNLNYEFLCLLEKVTQKAEES